MNPNDKQPAVVNVRVPEAQHFADAANSVRLAIHDLRNCPAMRALESLTPGGSEYIDDIPRCIATVRETRDSMMRALVDMKKRINSSDSPRIQPSIHERDEDDVINPYVVPFDDTEKLRRVIELTGQTSLGAAMQWIYKHQKAESSDSPRSAAPTGLRDNYNEFWRELSRKGDPERIHNKIWVGYRAGWEAYHAAALATGIQEKKD